ncbi:MAG: metallophosphoesterase [Bacteroidia bacterium]
MKKIGSLLALFFAFSLTAQINPIQIVPLQKSTQPSLRDSLAGKNFGVFSQKPSARDSDVVYRVFLVGDAGNDTTPNKTLQLLHTLAGGQDSTTVVFLGDNIYPQGYDGKAISAKKLQVQIDAADSCDHLLFVPGNHDWLAQKRKGQKALRKQGVYLATQIPSDTLGGKPVANGLFPADGPGPWTQVVAPGVRIVTIDTQWWLQGYPFHWVQKQQGHSVRERYKKMLTDLDSIFTVAEKNKEQVILCAHHPVYTNGEHGGYRKRFLHGLFNYTPLQIFGLMGLNRVLTQAMVHPRYKNMRNDLLEIFAKHKNLIYAAGHEHNLQLFKDAQQNYFIVSGSGSKISAISSSQFPSRYENGMDHGFFCVEILRNGSRRIVVYTEDGRRSVLVTN